MYMSRIEESHTAIVQEWTIPVWLKMFVFAVTLGELLIVMRALRSSATELFGISVSIILGIAFPLLFLMVLVTVWFVLFPTSWYSRMCYWIVRFLREQIIVISLLGMLYLLVAQAPIISFRGGLAWAAPLSLFVVGLLLKTTHIQDIPYDGAAWEGSSLKKFLGIFRPVPVWVPQVLVSLLPVGLVLLIISFVFGSSLWHYGPHSIFNDEVSYWVWLRSYHDVGLKAGYSAPNELLPFFEFNRYGEESPIYLYIYGFITKWESWFTALPLLVNFLLLSVSIFLVLRALKLTAGQTVFAGFAIVLTWPVLLYLPMTTQETLNQVIGILLSLAIIKLLMDREGVSPFGRFAIILFVYLAALIRLSWGLLLVPVLFYCLNGKLAWRSILAVLIGGGLYASAVVLISYLAPPINDTIRQGILDWGHAGLAAFTEKIYLQILFMVESRQLNANVGVLFQMAVAAGWSVSRLVHWVRSKKADLSAILHSFEAFYIYNVVSLVIAGLTFYTHKNFFRAFAPSMLLMFLLQIKRKDYKFLATLLMVSILLLPAYMDYTAETGNYKIVKADYTGGIPQSSMIRAEIEKFIAYDLETSNPWCNTLLIPLSSYDSRLTLIPSGIGISYILNPGTFDTPIKSRYALFDPSTYQTYKDANRLKLLVSLPIGDLYQNEGTDCSGGH